MRPKNGRTREAVLKALANGEWRPLAYVSAHTGETCPAVQYHVKALLGEGVLVRRKEVVQHNENGSSYRYLYRMNEDHIEEPVPEALPVAPAYRNLRLGETLAGYDSSLLAFASLCMEVRK